MARVVVINTDEFIRSAVASALEGQGHSVSARASAGAVDRLIEHERPDVVLLALRSGPEGADDLSTGRRLRSISAVPLLFVAESGRLEDRIAAFELGADDVLSKPFAIAELFARLEAVLRRGDHLSGRVLTVDDIVVDELAHLVTRGDRPIELTSIEFSLLATLLRHRGHVLSKHQLLNDVWGFEHFDVNLVEVHICALRRKLERYGPRVVQTVRGAGYVVRSSSRSLSSVAHG